MKKFTKLVSEAIEESQHAETSLNFLVNVYDKRYLRKKTGNPDEGMTGHMHLNTAEGIHGFVADLKDIKKLKAGGDVIFKTKYGKTVVVRISYHSKYNKHHVYKG